MISSFVSSSVSLAVHVKSSLQLKSLKMEIQLDGGTIIAINLLINCFTSCSLRVPYLSPSGPDSADTILVTHQQFWKLTLPFSFHTAHIHFMAVIISIFLMSLPFISATTTTYIRWPFFNLIFTTTIMPSSLRSRRLVMLEGRACNSTWVGSESMSKFPCAVPLSSHSSTLLLCGAFIWVLHTCNQFKNSESIFYFFFSKFY